LEIENGDVELGFLSRCQSHLGAGHRPDGALFIGKPASSETLIRLLKTLLPRSDPKSLTRLNQPPPMG
jgi:hypothetical protein